MRLSTSARVSLASTALALLATALAWYGVPATAPLPYAVHKLLHVVGVVVFGGNLVAGPVWVMLAYVARDRAALAFATRTLSAADIALTAPGLQLTAWNGVCLAAAMGGARHQPWLVESIALLAVTGPCGLVVLYAQERFVEAAQKDDDAATFRALLWWSLWGTLIGVPFGLVAWLMVSKDALLS